MVLVALGMVFVVLGMVLVALGVVLIVSSQPGLRPPYENIYFLLKPKFFSVKNKGLGMGPCE